MARNDVDLTQLFTGLRAGNERSWYFFPEDFWEGAGEFSRKGKGRL
jgi:hypothetical protein